MAVQRIWKYPVPIEDTFTIQMPSGSRILHVGTMDGINVSMWVRVTEGKPMEKYTYHVRGTGHPLGEAVEEGYIGSVITHGGQFIWHIFEHVSVSAL